MGSIIFNCFFNDFYCFTKNAYVHNFANDNRLTSFAQNVQTLKSLLPTERNIAIGLFKTNKMVVNPGKFQSIKINKKRGHINESFEIGDKVTEASSSAKLLGVQTDDKLNLNLYSTNICRSAANQLNVLMKLNWFLSLEARKVLLISSYSYSNFDYCPLGWIFSSTKSLNKTGS